MKSSCRNPGALWPFRSTTSMSTLMSVTSDLKTGRSSSFADGVCCAARPEASSSMKNRGMKNIIAGTAGHIDHGKTALVRALTGIDADRLEEEKRRGITIDLG